MPEFPRDMATIVEVLRWRSARQANRLIYRFLADGEVESERLTYEDLDRAARRIGGFLQSLELTGQRALLLCPSGPGFIKAFFGCLYAGVVAAPVSLPRGLRGGKRVESVAADARPRVALTTRDAEPAVAGAWGHPDAPVLAIEDIARSFEDTWVEPAIDESTLAFLQYTSGSTGAPKGAMVTHGNLMANEEMVATAFEYTEESTFVCWLPLFHDMGLIGNVLQPLYVGSLSVLMPPGAFLEKPIRWLQAFSRYGGCTGGGPNFAYDLCVRRTTDQQRRTLDLSTWSLAFNGSEPVRRETMDRFAEVFAPCGFRKGVFYPCYGLAEATLLVSGGSRSREPAVRTVDKDALEAGRWVDADDQAARSAALVSCGKTSLDQEIVIVDPATSERADPDQIGEIWVSGPNVAGGYWNRPEDTREVFHAHLATGEGPFLRTGDLGCMTDGNLFITGRLKDLIIIAGRNHFPQDIESTVEDSHAALSAGCGAAISVDIDERERLVIVQEVQRQHRNDPHDDVIASICAAVADEHEVLPYAVVLVRPGSVPKTTSGKIQRRACKAKFLAGDLVVLSERRFGEPASDLPAEPGERCAPPRTDTERTVAQICADLLGLERLGIHDDFFHCGGHSLLAVRIVSRLREALGVELPLRDIFEKPTVAALARRVEAVRRRADVRIAPAIARVRRGGGGLPLSFGQERLWFLDRLGGGVSTYNIPVAIRLRGRLNAGALEGGLREIVRRHEALRTTFAMEAGRPVQVISPAAELSLSVVDLRSAPRARREAAVRRCVLCEANRPFDLSVGPLVRATLLRLGAAEQVVLLTMHHIVSDGWSMGVLVAELGQLVESFGAGRPSLLGELAVQYPDFAQWQREWLTGDVLTEQLAYWRGQLAGVSGGVSLATDRPRGPIQSFRGAVESFSVPAAVTDSLASLGRGEGSTLFMTLLAAFSALLHRYSGRDDIVVGSPIANRGSEQIEGLIGFFVNTLVLRADVSGSPRFRELLGRVRETALGAYAHQALPFEALVAELKPERDLSRSPLFQVMFTFDDAAIEPPSFGGLRVELLEEDRGLSKYDLTLSMRGGSDGLRGWLEYNTDLFDGESIRRLASHFRLLLEGIASDPDSRVSDLPLLSEAERDELLVARNDTACDYRTDVCVHELFESRAAQTPDATAVTFEDQHVSYGELNRRANCLAFRLRSLGVGPESLVGLCVERSAALVVGLLGILKSGGAYVPLDPGYPRERLSFMAQDAGLAALVTESGLDGGVQDYSGPRVLVDAATESPTAGSETNASSGVTPANLAYAIYTSGSTGRPKGVAIPHGALVNFLESMSHRPGLGAQDVVLSVTTLSFDIAALELLLPLTVGARVVLSGRGEALDGGSLVRRLLDCRATTMQATPAGWRLVVGAGLSGMDHLRVLCGGEALWCEQAAELASRSGEVWNLYGPTETTVWSSLRRVAALGGSSSLGGVEPIGDPIANTQLYVLDERFQPVPRGVAGELYIGGVGLARGYLGRAALTSRSFVPCPFGAWSGRRMYGTGDVVRYTSDGELSFVGRRDGQVKIRGFRVELGEIESVLLRHPCVDAAVVCARESGPGDTRLVGYVVGSSAASPGVDELRAFVSDHLPEAMTPSTFMWLSSLPLTPSGKVDRASLPAPTADRPALSGDYAAPRDELERTIAGVWREVLELDQVGVNDNFFDLGGHSLLLARVQFRLRELLGRDVPIVEMFRRPTVHALAGCLTDAAAEFSSPSQGRDRGEIRVRRRGLVGANRRRRTQRG